MKYNLNNMMGLDIYLSSLSKSEYEIVSSKICDSSKIITPLTSWDIFSEGYKGSLKQSNIQQDILKVKTFAERMSWNNDIDGIFKNEAFEALIITDVNQRIIWVNKGFSKMTGYSKNEILNKTPRVLQGENTSNNSRYRISKKLRFKKPFKEVITNYRKDGTPYQCEVKIFPLFTDSNKTHFIALERQVA